MNIASAEDTASMGPDIDQIIVSAAYAPVRANAGSAPVTAKLGMISFEEADAELRQSKFEEALATLRGRFGELALEQSAYEVDVSISLVPMSGQAGVVIAADMTAPWEGCPVSFYIDALT